MQSGNRKQLGREPGFSVLHVTQYSYGEHEVDLLLEFFREKLMRVIIYSDAPDSLIAFFKEQMGVDLSKEHETFPSPNKRLWHATDVQKRKYVGIEDVRLANERRDWIKKQS